MLSCRNCGGNVTFDIESQDLSCKFCSCHFDPYLYEDKSKDALEEKQFQATIFTCPQCGGQLLSTENASAAFCSFCGASTILFSRLTKENKPGYIIPFKITKDNCKTIYDNALKNALYAPKELKKPDNVNGFRGIYMPHWSYYIRQKGLYCFDAKLTYGMDNVTYVDYYRLHGHVNAYYKGITHDASSSFSDQISEVLHPYNLNDLKVFTPGYLSGFYADTSDIPPYIYQKDAEAQAIRASQRRMEIAYAPMVCENVGSLNVETKRVDNMLFPVWFLSYRYHDRIAYAAINGQTGKLAASIPISISNYLKLSLLGFIPIFLVLLIFLTVTPLELLGFTLMFLVATSSMYLTELKAILEHETFADDKGQLFKKKGHKTSRSKKKAKRIPMKIYISIIALAVLLIFFFKISLPIFGVVAGLATIAAGVLTLKQIPKNEETKGRHMAFFFILLGLVDMFTLIISPVMDIINYSITFVTQVVIILSLIDLMRHHNLRCTQKLPQFDKQGGDDRA